MLTTIMPIRWWELGGEGGFPVTKRTNFFESCFANLSMSDFHIAKKLLSVYGNFTTNPIDICGNCPDLRSKTKLAGCSISIQW